MELTAVKMASNHVLWKAKGTDGVDDQGPADKILRIHFNGSLNGLPWLKQSAGWIEIDLSILIKEYPNPFDKAWLKNQCKLAAVIQGTVINTFMEFHL